jgi:hypothetical protein
MPALGAGLTTPSLARRQVSPPARARDDGPFAYVMRCACPPGHNGNRGGTVIDHARLFPIAVHEQILPSLNRAKIKVRWTDVVIRHKGYADPKVEARKLERNIKILERELIERPDDPFVLFNLGASALQQKRPEQYCSFDDNIYGHITRRNLAELAAERDDLTEAKRLWEAVLAECPGDRQALVKLGR